MNATEPSSYRVDISRADSTWVAVVRGLPAGATEVDHFDELDLEVRDLIAGLADRDPDSFELDWRYVQGELDYTAEVRDLYHWETEINRVQRNRDAARQRVIATLRAAGFSQRVIAEVIHTSHQRVAQLLAEAS